MRLLCRISKGEGRSRSDRVRQRVAKVKSQRGGWADFLNKLKGLSKGMESLRTYGC
jgi:hypothetical protein